MYIIYADLWQLNLVVGLKLSKFYRQLQHKCLPLRFVLHIRLTSLPSLTTK